MRTNLAEVAEVVHDLSRRLHPSILDDLGLVQAVLAERAAFSKKTGIALSFIPDAIPDSLPQQLALCLYRVIREGLKGRTYVTPLIAGKLLHSYQSGCQSAADTVLSLSSRQREVLQLLAESHSVKEIAAILNISTKTVVYHKCRMMEDLGIKSAAELIRYAVKQGITEP